MKDIAVCVIGKDHKYELERCKRSIKCLEDKGVKTFYADTVSGLTDRTEQYIVFRDVYDIWNEDKLDVCRKALEENQQIDLLMHSYVQRIGMKDVPFFTLGKDILENVLLYGVSGISAMIMNRSWLLGICQLSDHDIAFHSTEFYELLREHMCGHNINMKYIPAILSKHWNYYGKKTLGIKAAKEDILDRWKSEREEILRHNLFSSCYEFFRSYFPEYGLEGLFDSFMMKEKEIIAFLEEREQWFSQQVQLKNNEISKKSDFYAFMCNWVELHQTGKSISDVLLQEEIKTVAIYGAGKHGKMLFDELRTGAVAVRYWIDKIKKADKVNDCPIFSLEEELPEVDAVIVTPFREFETIEEALKNKNHARIISLSGLVGR